MIPVAQHGYDLARAARPPLAAPPMKASWRVVKVALLALLLAAAVPAPEPARAQQDAAEQIVHCPVNEISTGIMTQLPGEWWYTPQLGRLSGAEIRQVGGEPVLTCLYHAYGKDVAIMRKPPDDAMSCQVRSSGFSFVCGQEEILTTSAGSGSLCQDSIQNRVEWDYKGSNRWARRNLERICANAADSRQPGECFDRVMHGKISYGNGTRWRWRYALELCAGTLDAAATIACFTDAIERETPWPEAIESCRVKP